MREGENGMYICRRNASVRLSGRKMMKATRATLPFGIGSKDQRDDDCSAAVRITSAADESEQSGTSFESVTAGVYDTVHG